MMVVMVFLLQQGAPASLFRENMWSHYQTESQDLEFVPDDNCRVLPGRKQSIVPPSC